MKWMQLERRVPAWKRATFLQLHSLWCKSAITHGFVLKIIIHTDRQVDVEIFCQVLAVIEYLLANGSEHVINKIIDDSS